MVEPHDRDALREELKRLLAGLDFYRSWRIATLRRTKGQVTQADLNEIVMPGSTFLDLFDTAKGRSAHTILTEVQRWYAHTASDLAHIAALDDQAQIEVAQFFSDFRKTLGFDFFREAGLPRKIAQMAFKQDKISKHLNYETLKEIELDQSQTLFSQAELSKISALLRAYELEQKHRL